MSNKYHTRNLAIATLRRECSDDESKTALSVGLVPDKLAARFNELMAVSDIPHTDTDIDKATYSSWFFLNPDKVAGKMQYGFFKRPMEVAGTKADIDKMFASL